MKNNLTTLPRNNFSLLVLLLVSFLVYLPSLDGDFVVDDTPLIKGNPHLSGNHVGDYFTKGFWENTALENNTIAMYRPLVLVVLSLSHGIWGSNPAGYHALLLLLHLADTALAYILIRKLTGGSPVAASLGAAIFALHPTRVESVAWLSGIPDPLAIFFLLGAMLAHMSFTAAPDKWRYLVMSLLCFQMALWSKEVAVVFPLVAVAHDLIYRRKINWVAVLLYMLPLAAYLATRSFALGATGQWGALNFSRFSRMVDFVPGYSELLAFPTQIPLYLQIPEHPAPSALGWLSAIALIALAGFSWRTFNPENRKALAFSAFWIIAFSWPAVLIMLYMDGYFAARYLYIPAIGIALYASILFSHMNATYPSLKIPIAAAFVLAIAFYGAITWKEIAFWHDDGAIYEKVAKSAPEYAVGFSGMGHFLMKQENFAAAEKNFLIALQKPKASELRARSLVALGTIYGMSNRLEQSRHYLQEAVQIEPNNSEALTGLGNLALMQVQTAEAISLYEKAIAARPDNFEAATNLAMAYEKHGQPERAALIRRTIR